MKRNKIVGHIGERLALAYLKEKGYSILAQNWRFKKAEADLIVKDEQENIIVFVEVKTRTSNAFGEPSSFVSEAQEQLLYDLALAYCEEIQHDWEIRFDIIGILFYGDQYHIRHYEDAFFPYDI